MALIVAATAMALATNPGAARPRRHRAAAVTAQPPQPSPHQFYPEHVEGGVAGNYSFNNQIRKHTDPLNANGGR